MFHGISFNKKTNYYFVVFSEVLSHTPEISENLGEKVKTLRNFIENTKNCFKILKKVQNFIEDYKFFVFRKKKFFIELFYLV